MTQKILLIGANGQLGSDIQRVFSFDNSFSLFALSHDDIDITDFNKTEKILKKIRPDVIVNTAAYHKVDESEDNPFKAFNVNSIAQKKLAEVAQEIKSSLAYISTDYVFGLDGKRNFPYKENDNPGPINVYGVSKLAGENFTRFICKKHFVVRVSGLFGKAGPSGKGENFVDLMIRLGREKGKVNVVDDQILAPTYTLNVAENLLSLLKTENYGLYHMTSMGSCSWFEFSKEIFNLLKMQVKCNKVNSGFFNTRARRPNYSVLVNSNLNKINLNQMRHWRQNLKLYLKEKKYL